MEIRFYDKPGLSLAPAAQHALRTALRRIAATSLDPVPDYQCLASAPSALDDKLIAVAYAGPPAARTPVAFTSAFFLPAAPALALARPVLHTGLTVVDPAHRRRGVVTRLFGEIAARAFPTYGGEGGLWVTCLAEVPSSLGLVTRYLENVFPAPEGAVRREEHGVIARAVSEGCRKQMLIAPGAVLDEERFVFRGSNDWERGKCFKKDPEDERWRHRDEEWNTFFKEMLKAGSGDEVLQVGFCSRERVELILEVLGRRRSEIGAKL